MLVTLGTDLKRKSIEKVNPSLPRVSNHRQKSTEGRTNHKEYKPPSQQLKQFRKKQLYTLSTDKSLSNTHQEQQTLMKQSRFDDDHHNTQSIAQLLNSKMVSNPPTVRTGLSRYGDTSNLNSDQKNLSAPRESIDEDSIAVMQSELGSKQKENLSENEGKEGQNYDDYVLGQKVDEDDQSNDNKYMHKKYMNDDLPSQLNGYKPKTQSELRLEQKYWNKEFKKYQQVKQDKQILTLMQQYHQNKQKMMNQSKKKHETQRVLASLHHQKIVENKVEKSCSLPVLKPKLEVLIPEYQNQQNFIEKANKNMIARRIEDTKDERTQLTDIRLKKSLSFAKLGFGRKRVRTICQQDVYEDEMTSVEEIRSKLRSKGIMIDAKKLTQGLINTKNYPVENKTESQPPCSLPSNPLLKKFPL